MRHTGNRIGGSNPSLSAITLLIIMKFWRYLGTTHVYTYLLLPSDKRGESTNPGLRLGPFAQSL